MRDINMVKKNLVFVTHSQKKGGAEQSLIHLINHINIKEFNIFLICPPNTLYISEITNPIKIININLPGIKKSFGLAYLKTIFKIKKVLKKENIDIVHANGWRAPWYIAPFFFNKKIKTFWHHRDKFESHLFNYLLPHFFNNVICISEFVKSTLHHKHFSKAVVIYNGIDSKDVKDVNERKIRIFKKNGKFVIGTFGRITEWKRFESIIDAVNLFSKNIPSNSWELKIVGGVEVDGSVDYYNYLKKLVKENNLENNITFTGHIRNPIDLMSNCDLTINFSDREPFGRVIIESLLAKTPVIVANSGGAPEIIEISKGGYIVEDGNVTVLSKKINQVYSMNTEQYDELSMNGFKSVLKNFNMVSIVKDIEDLYRI
jgi:L-malate glycosyltransferase